MDAQIAPEFPDSLDWLNLTEPLRMAQLRGKVCALAFVNAGSAWSSQRLNDLAHLHARHGERLNVVAVHLPKFEHERDPRRVAKRLRRQKIDFPIAHDPDWAMWQHYGIEAWPTVVLIDGEGRVRERVVGDGPVRELDARVGALVADLVPQSRNPRPIVLRRAGEPALPLRFPVGLALSGNYLYVADSNHHRILECDQGGRVLRQFGSGGPGFIDGPMELAAFNRPQGIAVERDLLYVADGGNHAVRRIQLRTGDIDTVFGAGRRGTAGDCTVGDPRAVVMDQPRAVAMAGGRLFVATSGDNRIWCYDLGNHQLHCLAGSGALDLVDGKGAEAAFAEPVALAAVQQMVYVCDAAGSAIRSVNARTGQVQTLLGQGAWEFGHADGKRIDARLQQPQAIALDPDAPRLWIADSGNDSLRVLRLGGGELSRFELPRPLHAPSGLVVSGGVVWIADTDAHAVLRLETATGDLHHIPIGE
ncbi:thioredoxin-like domain-containing protein [Luteimonas sp. RD2P54]|uniref:Thioredoxin-like domain-containing protein n=1 Tax=Luteimonas endophytica TaxID=3042023 RepID=A0ABT6JBZ5_9GAMM|nr:thioredoxin-like domain-containing protein [Luteimonas endophytica]MDH5824351.1 thioredoxin-like domain-containing protein [Luteimonas endophytica]